MSNHTRRQFCLAAGGVTTGGGGDVWLEPASFERLGGWMVDHQSLDKLGSAYLLAHGMGQPVRDAETPFPSMETGEYFVFVRTRDWVGPWKSADTPPELRAEGSPGAFEVRIDGTPLKRTFGAVGADWHWEEGGKVRIGARASIGLRDLMGFDGRCAGLLFSRTPQPELPNTVRAVRLMRERLTGSARMETRRFDFVVVGGGVAGICAAVAAARRGLKVALVQNRPVLGGTSSSEIRVSPGSVRSVEPYAGLGSVLAEFDWKGQPEPAQQRQFQQMDEARRKLVEGEPNLTLYLSHEVVEAEKKQGALIEAVRAQAILSGAMIRLEAPLFADCSGDSQLGFIAAAEWRMGREGRGKTGESRAPESGDQQVLGSTLHWYSKNADGGAGFPATPWALQFTEASCQNAMEGAWNWETGFRQDLATQTELVRDHMLRAIYGNWSFQKNASARKEIYRDLSLAWVGYVLGKRESRRLMGDVVYSEHDLTSGKEYTDALIACNWGIDIHLPNPVNDRQFAGWAFRAIAEHLDKGRAPMRWQPYRCLYSRNVENLFMAGRNTSCTHVALAWFRCQRTTAMMGEAVGLAAAICAEKACRPRGVYERHLAELLRRARVGAGRGGGGV